MKMNFDYFQIQKSMSQADRAEKVDKNGVIFLVFMFLSWVMVLKSSKMVNIFSNIVETSTNCSTLNAIISETVRHSIIKNTFSERV